MTPPTLHRLGRTVLPALAASLVLAACGAGEEADDAASSTSPSADSTSASPSAPATPTETSASPSASPTERPSRKPSRTPSPTPSPTAAADPEVVVLAAPAMGDQGTEASATRIDTEGEQSAYAASLPPELQPQLQVAAGQLSSAGAAELYAQVVSVGCTPPTPAQVSVAREGGGVVMSAPTEKGGVQCRQPMQAVALALVPVS